MLKIVPERGQRYFLLSSTEKTGGGVRIIGGGVEMVRYNNNRGVGIIGGRELLGEIENSRFLR